MTASPLDPVLAGRSALFAEPRDSGAAPPDRRASARLLAYWRELAGRRAMPLREEMRLPGPQSAWADMFLIRIGPAPTDYVFEFAGADLVKTLGADPGGRRVADMMPLAIRERILFFQRAVVLLKSPVDEAGRFHGDDGGNYLFRMIVLPLSGTTGDVSHLIGVFTCKPD